MSHLFSSAESVEMQGCKCQRSGKACWLHLTVNVVFLGYREDVGTVYQLTWRLISEEASLQMRYCHSSNSDIQDRKCDVALSHSSLF
jgi:hypothetical protein